MVRILTKTQALEYLETCRLSDIAEPNIFNHPAFLRPALDNLAPDNCGLIVLDDPGQHYLMPFQIRRAGLGLKKTICSWGNIYTTQTTPLISAAHMSETLTAVLHALGHSQYVLPDTLLLPDLDLYGPVAQTLMEIAKAQRLPVQIIRQAERPVLDSTVQPEAYLANAIGKNHYRDYRRLWRRLSETGHLRYQIAAKPDEIAHRLEDFLQLEAAGWKGKSGSALLSKANDAQFAREAIGALAQQGLVHVHMLTLDDQLIAGLVVFYSGDRAWTWKTAFDENLRSFSPGVLLMIELLKTQLEDPVLHLTDSCAIPDHPVMSRLFQERRTFATIILGLNDHSQGSVDVITRQLKHYDFLRATIETSKSYFCKFSGK